MRWFVCLLLVGCASVPPVADPTKRDVVDIEECMQRQVDLYGDLCAEAQGVALNYRDEESFFYGMMCGLQAVARCGRSGIVEGL